MSGPIPPGAFDTVTVVDVTDSTVTFSADAGFLQYIRDKAAEYGSKFVAFVTPACGQSGGGDQGEGS